MTEQERKALVKGYLGRTVTVTIDRPIGYVHQKKNYTLTYPINYGYLEGVIGGDGEELDVYVLGIDCPVQECTVRVIGIAYRADDVEDKLIAAPEECSFTASEMMKAIHFQEQYYQTTIETISERT